MSLHNYPQPPDPSLADTIAADWAQQEREERKAKLIAEACKGLGRFWEFDGGEDAEIIAQAVGRLCLCARATPFPDSLQNQATAWRALVATVGQRIEKWANFQVDDD